MIKNIFLCVCFVMITGCATVADIAINAAGSALGNMLDRRVDEPTENENEKENDDECKNCEDDKR
jgi:hypothetical protein